MGIYFTTPADIAAALRRLADDLDGATDAAPLPPVAVSVDVQVCAWSDANDTERSAVVDLLSRAAHGVPGRTACLSGGSWHHGALLADTTRADGLDVDVYTKVTAPRTAVAA